jgi:hypothetical protein
VHHDREILLKTQTERLKKPQGVCGLETTQPWEPTMLIDRAIGHSRMKSLASR